MNNDPNIFAANIDRDMDTAFDSILVLNVAVEAILQSLPSQVAVQVVARIDSALNHIHEELNPPAAFHLMHLNYWRNKAAEIAGLPARNSPV